MNDLLKAATAVLVASAVAMIWGFSYRSDHAMEPLRAAFFGQADPTFETAGWAAGLGVLAFLIGIALLVGGLVQRSHNPTSPSGDKH
jgi:hypothetical protein